MSKKIISAVLVTILSLILCSCSININLPGNAGMNRAEDTSEKTLNVGSIKEINASTPVGSVKISTWDKNDIYIKATKVNNGFKSRDALLDELKNAEVVINQEGDTLSVKAYLPKFKDNGMSVQFEISVPKQIASYKVNTEVGDVRLADINGQVDIVNNVGKIDVDGCTGKINLKAVTGDVTVRNTTLKGDSTLTSNTGRVLFDGSISSEGTYKITTNVGKIDLTLPQGSAFDIDATTNVGNIDCKFDVSGEQSDRRVNGKVNGGGPVVVVNNNVGSISIDRK